VLAVIDLFFSSRRRHTRSKRDWSSDVCSSDLLDGDPLTAQCSEMIRHSTATSSKPAVDPTVTRRRAEIHGLGGCRSPGEASAVRRVSVDYVRQEATVPK